MSQYVLLNQVFRIRQPFEPIFRQDRKKSSPFGGMPGKRHHQCGVEPPPPGLSADGSSRQAMQSAACPPNPLDMTSSPDFSPRIDGDRGDYSKMKIKDFLQPGRIALAMSSKRARIERLIEASPTRRQDNSPCRPWPWSLSGRRIGVGVGGRTTVPRNDGSEGPGIGRIPGVVDSRPGTLVPRPPG